MSTSSALPETTPASPAAAAFDPGAELHDPALYQPGPDLAQGVEHLSDIGPREIAFYREHGYLVVRQAFSPAEVRDALTGLSSLIMGEKPGFDGISFEAAAREKLASLTLEQRQDAVRKLMWFVGVDARLGALSHHPELLAVTRALMDGRTPFMFQDMALLKPPALGREKPWHQDLAYFDYPLDTPVIGVWIALDEATIKNGCMQLLPGQHREPIVHFKRRDWQICDATMLGRRSVAAPLKPGGLLLFDGLLPHGTPHNFSGQRRRALQFHYAPDGITKTTPEDRMRIFGSEGKDVTC